MVTFLFGSVVSAPECAPLLLTDEYRQAARGKAEFICGLPSDSGGTTRRMLKAYNLVGHRSGRARIITEGRSDSVGMTTLSPNFSPSVP